MTYTNDRINHELRARALALTLTPEQEARCLLLMRDVIAIVVERHPAILMDEAIAVIDQFMDNADAIDDVADDYVEDFLTDNGEDGDDADLPSDDELAAAAAEGRAKKGGRHEEAGAVWRQSPEARPPLL
jgi:hypothetical protein